MGWNLITALVLAITINLFPAVFAWYLNIGGIVKALKGSISFHRQRDTMDENKSVSEIPTKAERS
jgi:hypothetical protein